MLDLSALDNLPDISILEEEDITLEGTISEMITDFEDYWEERHDEPLVLYPGDDRRIFIETVGAKLFQAFEILDNNYRMNFIKWMYGDRLKNWGAGFGFIDSGLESAQTIIRFSASAVQETDITIPAGTRVTAGDNVFFALDDDLVIEAGEEYADATATCTQEGASGNGYAAGQINIIADPVNLVASATNTIASAGGHDEYTDDELKEQILNYMSSYSTSGPEDAYSLQAESYSVLIADAKTIADTDATVHVYVILKGGQIPGETFCSEVKEYLVEKAANPDTDRIVVEAPNEYHYNIEGTYYIPESLRDAEDGVKEAVTEAVNEFATETAEEIGTNVNQGTLIAYAMAAGAGRVVINSPTYHEVGKNEAAICDSITLNYGGLE